MSSKPLIPKDCQDELDDIRSRSQNAELAQPPVCDEFDSSCVFYHFINEQFWPSDHEKPNERALHFSGLSAFVEGRGFERLNLKKEIRLFKIRRNWKSLGVICFSASDILNKSQFSFEVRHDPHKFQDKLGLQTQSRNHVQIVCKKNSTVRKALVKACKPVFKPGDEPQEVLKSRRLLWIAMLIAASLALFSISARHK